MNRFVLLFVLTIPAIAFSQTPGVFDNPDLVRGYQQTITPQELAGQLYFYASDYLEGRETSARGQHLAALYLAGQHQAMGLEAKGTAEAHGPHDSRRFLQPFDLEQMVITRATLSASRGSQSVASTTFGTSGFDGHSYFVFGGDGTARGSVVFGGHGISSANYDDITALREAGVDITGKWLVILDSEPMTAEGESLITEDGELSDFSANAFQKLRTILQSGEGMPAGFLFIGDSDPRGSTPISTRAEERLERVGALSLPGTESGTTRQLPPMLTVSAEFASDLLGRSVLELRDRIANTRAPIVFEAEGVELTGVVEKGTETVVTENVAAFIEGSDPVLKNEVVILSAHLDHIGMNPLADDDGISNGADDDGSGTIALLEMAEAFQEAKADGYGPRRSVLFLHVSGEEKGLLGSAYYADSEPLVPLANTVANLNIDMIGRHDPSYEGSGQYIDIIGAELISTDIDEINTRVNEVTGLNLELSKRYNSPDDPNQFFRRSDHWNFGKHGIPFIFYFNGTHEDYHGVDDEPEKIDYDLLALRTRLIFGTAWQLANQEARPAVSGEGFN